MFTDMMAEMGAYGEAFIATDQIPVKLAPEVLKNTNVKIIQWLAATDDCVNAGLEPFFQALSLAEQVGWNPPSRTGAPSG